MNLPLPAVVPGTRSKGEVNTCTPLLDMGPDTTSLAIEFLNSSIAAAAAHGVLLVVGTSAVPAADASAGDVSCSHSARLVPHSRTPTASPFVMVAVGSKMSKWCGGAARFPFSGFCAGFVRAHFLLALAYWLRS